MRLRGPWGKQKDQDGLTARVIAHLMGRSLYTTRQILYQYKREELTLEDIGEIIWAARTDAINKEKGIGKFSFLDYAVPIKRL